MEPFLIESALFASEPLERVNECTALHASNCSLVVGSRSQPRVADPRARRLSLLTTTVATEREANLIKFNV